MASTQTASSTSDGAVYIGSIDQGTTSTRFLIFDKAGRPVAWHQIEFEQMYPHAGWHEQDPKEIVTSVETCIEEATKDFERQGYNKSSIKTIGITNQRETTIVWDENTGEALYNAIAWPDTRTASLVRELKKRPGADELQPICGLPLSTYPSAVKLTWLLRNVPAVKTAYSAGTLAFGTVDTWLLLKLNPPSSSIYVTDATNASRTMLADLRSLAYSPKLLSFFDLDRDKIHLPTIVPSSDPAAFGRLGRGILEGVPITGCLGDQSAALVGQCGFQPGQAKNTYGTGCFLLYNVGPQPVFSSHGLLATVAYHFGGHDSSSSGNDSGGGGGGPIYALEGSIAVAGSGVKFLVNNLGLAQGSSEVTALAGQVEDSGGVVFVTAFSGLFAPYWIDDARGTLFGITQHTRKGHVARATLEATCFQTKAILDAMEKDSGHKLEMLAVDGGMSNSDLCMQTQADLISIPVDRPSMRETTSLGAAIAAGLATGIYRHLTELLDINREDRTVFRPQRSARESASMFRTWTRAVEMCRGWVAEEEKVEEVEEEERKVDEAKASGRFG